jgi:hypothetical protein
MDINDPEAIGGFAEHEAESAGYDRSVASEMDIPPGLQDVADQYQEAIDEALADWSELRGFDLESIYDAGVDGVLVHLTVVESGRSITDGELDHLMRRSEQQDLADYLQGRLSRYADFTGSGRFQDEIRDAVYEAAEAEKEDEYEPNGGWYDPMPIEKARRHLGSSFADRLTAVNALSRAHGAWHADNRDSYRAYMALYRHLQGEEEGSHEYEPNYRLQARRRRMRPNSSGDYRTIMKEAAAAIEDANVGDRVIRTQVHPETGQLFVNYVNLPQRVFEARQGGGAEGQNNRIMITLDFKRDGKVKVSGTVNAITGREDRLRGKTAIPSKAVAYVVSYLERIASEYPPRFTHTRM